MLRAVGDLEDGQRPLVLPARTLGIPKVLEHPAEFVVALGDLWPVGWEGCLGTVKARSASGRACCGCPRCRRYPEAQLSSHPVASPATPSRSACGGPLS